MVNILSLNQSSVPFIVKLTDCDNDAIRNISNIAEQRIAFINPNGLQFDKIATLDADLENPSQQIALSNIVGNGIDGDITVTIPNTNTLKEGEIVSITNTTDFNITDVPLHIIDDTTFSYNLGTVGNSIAESSGDVTTQGEFLITFTNLSSDVPQLLNVVGMWHYFGKVKQTDNGIFATSEAVIFHVSPYDAVF